MFIDSNHRRFTFSSLFIGPIDGQKAALYGATAASSITERKSHELPMESGRYCHQNQKQDPIGNSMSNPKSSSQPVQISQPAIPELASDLIAYPHMAPVIEIFLSEFPALMERIRTAAKQKDLAGIKTAAHKLKGAAGSAGFVRLFDLADQVERHVEQGHLEAALPLIDDLDRICRLATPTASPTAKS
jgi:HPt (histidine-containing phosphotransfer) domain-containing protein